MSQFQGKYFSAEGGLSYKNLLKHFERQAKGEQNLTLMRDYKYKGNAAAKFRRPTLHGSLILVDVGAENDIVNSQGEKQPKVEIFDPTEGIRRRAVEQVHDEQQRDKTTSTIKKPQSSKHRQQGSTSKRKASTSAKPKKSSNKAIKRARDIFET